MTVVAPLADWPGAVTKVKKRRQHVRKGMVFVAEELVYVYKVADGVAVRPEHCRLENIQ